MYVTTLQKYSPYLLRKLYDINRMFARCAFNYSNYCNKINNEYQRYNKIITFVITVIIFY